MSFGHFSHIFLAVPILNMPHSRERKAQAAVFESVLIFTAGVALFMMSYAVFTVYQSYFTTVGLDDQLRATNEYIKTHIILLAESPTMIANGCPKELVNVSSNEPMGGFSEKTNDFVIAIFPALSTILAHTFSGPLVFMTMVCSHMSPPL